MNISGISFVELLMKKRCSGGSEYSDTRGSSVLMAAVEKLEVELSPVGNEGCFLCSLVFIDAQDAQYS